MICLEKPGIGPILDMGLFDDVLQRNRHVENGYTECEFEPDDPLVKALAHVASLEHGQAQTGGILISSVEPGSSQASSRWHIDQTPIVAAPNVLATEFLVGDTASLERLIANRKHSFPAGRLDDDSLNNFRIIADHAAQMRDEELRKMGFSIWRARPREVTMFNYRHIHRSTTNKGPSSLKRVYGFIQDYEE